MTCLRRSHEEDGEHIKRILETACGEGSGRKRPKQGRKTKKEEVNRMHKENWYALYLAIVYGLSCKKALLKMGILPER